VSLDGFIAGPNGEHDWIVMDPSIDFAAMFRDFDTAVMGRKTYEVPTAQGGQGALPGLDVVVFSRICAWRIAKSLTFYNSPRTGSRCSSRGVSRLR
jgi:dihydrofolate reductase